MANEELIKHLRQLGKYSEFNPNYLLLAADRIEELSGRVEVVRCKDCKHVKLDLMEKGLAVCRRAVLKNGQLVPLNLETNYNDFCSYGERKESEVDTE